MKSLDATADKDSYSFYIDEKNKAYGEILHSFKHKGHYDTIIIKKDITTNLKMQMVNSMENFLYMFIWFFFFSVVSVLVCLKFIFKPLQSAIDSSFENVVDNNYQTRIEDPLYGEEISKIVHRFNAVLDRMHELVQNNLNSMQDVSHEIKTYLTAIKQSVDVIKIYGKSDDKLVAEKLNAIEDNIIRGTAIISTTLELARLKQIPNIDSANYYDVKYLVNFLLRFKQETYPSFIFETDYDSEEVEIFIDRNHFFLMMNPILDNAVKYSMNSNIVKIDTISKRTDNMVYISITNTGVVIDQKRDSFSLRSLLSWEKFGEFKTRIWFRLDHS
ncbi:sensor histidine kinase (plasmid) [Bacillus toyonensis]